VGQHFGTLLYSTHYMVPYPSSVVILFSKSKSIGPRLFCTYAGRVHLSLARAMTRARLHYSLMWWRRHSERFLCTRKVRVPASLRKIPGTGAGSSLFRVRRLRKIKQFSAPVRNCQDDPDDVLPNAVWSDVEGRGGFDPTSVTCFALCWHSLFYFSMLRLCTLCTSVSSVVIRSWPPHQQQEPMDRLALWR
jgi:hypothetical protein